MTDKHVCLVTPGHPSTNPRVVKEADALIAAGYKVSVVSGRYFAWADQADHAFAERPWKIVERVAFGQRAPKWQRIRQGFVRRLCLALFGALGRHAMHFPRLAALAWHPAVWDLGRAAARVKADIYIGHNLAALPAVAWAAHAHAAKFAFDAEDYHFGELSAHGVDSVRQCMVDAIDRRWLPRCAYVTAASPGIAEALARHYGIGAPTVLLNVLPMVPVSMQPKKDRGQQPSLYWFSQTIGLDRGIQTVIKAVAVSRTRPALYLRGNISESSRKGLQRVAAEVGMLDGLHFMPLAPPDMMAALAAAHDVGLATETGFSDNNNRAISNKLFTYLSAGIPVLASNTSGQAWLAHRVPGAIQIFEQNDYESLARSIDAWLGDKHALAVASEIARQSATTEFNWETEAAKLITLVDDTLGA